MVRQDSKILSVDSRPLIAVGNSVGQTFDAGAMEDLGLIDDDGDIAESVDGRQIIYEDGTVEIQLDLPEDLAREIAADD